MRPITLARLLRETLVAATLLIFAVSGFAADDRSAAVVVVGNARFTVVTSNCVRMEYSDDAKFVDEASLFAANRGARADDVRITHEGDATVIATPAFRLRYTPDGKPFSPSNLSADVVLDGGKTAKWTPGAPNPGNLGGTARTLDGWDGARDLGQGILSRDGWYCLDDSHSPLFTKDWVQARPKEAGSDWYLFAYGSDYRAALRSLTAIGGPVPLPRKYVLGTWYSRYWPYSSEDFRAIVKEYAEHDFPLDMLVLDMDWHREGWTGYSWNRELLPDAEALLKWLHEQGLHLTLNDHPADGVGPHEDAYEKFMRDMGEDPAGKKTLPYDAGSKKYMTTLYKDVLKPLLDAGCDFFWLDWQQYPNTRSIPELTNLFWLNHFYFQFTSADGQRGQDFSRWGGWGSHRYPIQFSGDASTSFPMLAFEIPFTSTAGNVGCFFWSHDIGGHMRGRNEESYARWCQFGATTAALRSHSTRDKTMDRRPWAYPKWVEDSIRVSFHLRSELLPYIYTSAQQTASRTVPLNRPMYFEYPHEERAYHSSQEYLFGDNLLAAPVAMPGHGPDRVGWQVVWFPPGDDWFNFFTGERFAGGTEQLVAADINEFPLYVRGGAPLPMQAYQPRMTSAPLDTLIVRCYPGAEGKTGTYSLYEDDGVTTAYQRGESAVTALSYVYRDGAATIRVAPTEGKFAGQLPQRALTIELPGTAKASSATIDGAAAADADLSYDPTTFTNRLRVAARSIRAGCTIVIGAAPAGSEELREKARARRGGFEFKRADLRNDAKRLAELIAAMRSDQDPSALLASFGIALFEKNETTYRWPEKGTLGLYAPPGLIDGELVTYAFDPATSGEVPQPIPLKRDDSLGGLAPLAMTGSAASKPVLPSTPSRSTRGKVRFAIGGRAVALSGPEQPIDFASVPENLARRAHVSASSATDESPAQAAIDGVAGGYPSVPKNEWTTRGEKSGASITLSWDAPQSIERVWLFDRPNETDQVTAGQIVFDDGTTLPFGALPNDASTGIELKVPPRKTRTLTVKITGVKEGTLNTGLSEVVVIGAGAGGK